MKHGEDVDPGEICLGEGVGRSELNVWFPLRPNARGVIYRVALAYTADRRIAKGILQEECQQGGDVV